MAFTCPVMSPGPLDSFTALESYSPELKDCLEKTEKLCRQTSVDKSSQNFRLVTARAFDEIKRSHDFQEFFCQNFEKGKISFNPERKCQQAQLTQELASFHSCDFISKLDDNASEPMSICQQLLTDELKKPTYLTNDLKNNFTKTLTQVIEGFKKIHSNDKAIHQILSKISLGTDFDFRLSSFVAGARDRSEVSGCDSNWGEAADWCQGDYFILPGGRIFSEPENLELILAHEVGHIINKVSLPEKNFSEVSTKLRSCNHLDSKNLNEDQLRSETSADIHMARYHKEFMPSSSVETHFCQYNQKENYQISHYLHPYHRQALINCYSQFSF